MTIYVFPFPVSIAQSENLPGIMPRVFSYDGFEIHAFDGFTTWYCTKTNRIKKDAVQSDQGAEYWIAKDGYAFRLRWVSYYPGEHKERDEMLKTIIDTRKDQLTESLSNMLTDAKNPEAYEARGRAAIAQRKAEQATADGIAQGKREELERRAAYELTHAQILFGKGEMISAEHFEQLCKANGVKMHIRTLGMLRNRVTSLGHENAKVYGGWHVSDKLWLASKELFEKVKINA